MELALLPEPASRSTTKEGHVVANIKAETSRTLKRDWMKMVDELGIEGARAKFIPSAKPRAKAKAKAKAKTVRSRRKKQLAGSKKRKKMADDKAELVELAAKVSSELELLRNGVASDQSFVQAACAGETSSSSELSAQAKGELREFSKKLALRALALKGVAERLESQKQALEASTNASAKHIARLRQNLAKAIPRAHTASKKKYGP